MHLYDFGFVLLPSPDVVFPLCPRALCRHGIRTHSSSARVCLYISETFFCGMQNGELVKKSIYVHIKMKMWNGNSNMCFHENCCRLNLISRTRIYSTRRLGYTISSVFFILCHNIII